MQNQNIKPPRLRYGDTIGIVSPCDAKNAEKLEPSLKKLEEMGFQIKRGERLYHNDWGYADSDVGRAADFNRMIADNEVKMVFFGGGEVASEVLPLIDYEAAKANPKIYMSYSDGTSILNAITAKSGMVTYHGQTPRTFEQLSDYNLSHFKAALMDGGDYVPASPWATIRSGDAEGILIGGYTQNIALLVDSQFLPLELDKDYILFLEDHEWFSIPAAVARYLACIAQSKLFGSVKALVFGQYRNGEQDEIVQIIKRFGDKFKIPVFKCDDFGHCENNAILPIGQSAKNVDGKLIL